MAMVEVINPIARLHNLLGEIPHSVQLFDLFKVTNGKCASALKRLESELKRPIEDEEEMVRRTNLSTILLFHLNQPTKALDRNGIILEKYPNNITALVNRVYIQMAKGHEWEAEGLLADLKLEWSREGQDFLRASAFADEAYSLSRISPKFYVRSIWLFLKAIEKFPGNVSWKFGCALSCKRCLSLATGITSISSDDLKMFCERAVSFLFDVATNGEGNLAALSWAHLGELLGQLKKTIYPLSDNIVSVASTLCPFSAQECLIKALQIDASKEDESVLERCGYALQFSRPHIKYESALQDCYTLLVKAYNLRPTSYGCDKLASVLLKMVENGITPHGHSGILCLEETEGCKTFPRLNALQISPAKPSASSHTSLENAARGNPQTGYQSTHKGKVKTIRAVIPSTRVVNKYPGHPLLIQAAEFLTKSVQLTEETSMIALQNLGMMFRRLDRPECAIASFRKILSFPEASLYEKVNAYEQTGFCHLDISETPNISDKERKNEREQGKFMLKRAVEEAACLVASLPNMSRENLDYLESYPTLKELLSNEPRPEHMKDIAKLCQLIGNNYEALDWYTKLQEIDPYDVDTLHDVVVTHIRLKDFETAQNSFNVLMGSTEGRQLLEKKPDLLNQVYLGTIRYLMKSTSEENMNHLKMSCRTVFDYKHRNKSRKNEECDGPYDIFILDNPDVKGTEAEALHIWLSDTCGLHVTRNDNDVNFGSCSFLHETGFIANCKIVMVVLGPGQLDSRNQTLLSIALGEKGSDFVVCVVSEELEVPSLLRGSLSVKRPSMEDGNVGYQRFLLQCFMSTLGLNFDTFPWIE